ncbi:MAG: hypothetical protein EP332_07535 [Bacteroidetes bacterium]|nr:MAG: hypothetical protein EP332_07535 [Bacteroidota bacterium]
MKEITRIGVWLDHTKAHLIEYHPFAEQIQTVFSPEMESREGAEFKTNFGDRASNNEDRLANKTQNQHHEFYKLLEKSLLPYDEILLFGSGNARNEFKNILKADKAFQAKTIFVEAAEHLSENQLKAYVRDYFRALDVKRSS